MRCDAFYSKFKSMNTKEVKTTKYFNFTILK